MENETSFKQHTKILLIEDDTFLSDLYLHILTQEGYTVETALDGAEGLAKAHQHPTLILLDIMLPSMDGLELLRQLKAEAQTRSIPIVLLTNLGQEKFIKQAFDTGAQGYFMKMRISPYDLPKLIQPFIEDPNHTINFSELSFD